MTTNAIRALQTALAAKRAQGQQVALAMQAPAAIGEQLRSLAEMKRRAEVQDRQLGQGDRRLDQQDATFEEGVRRYDAESGYRAGRDAKADARYDTEWDYKLGRDAVADQRYDTKYADDRSDRADDVAFRNLRAQVGDDQWDRAQGHRESVDADRASNEWLRIMQGDERLAQADRHHDAALEDRRSGREAEAALARELADRRAQAQGTARPAGAAAAAKDYMKFRADLAPKMRTNDWGESFASDPRTAEAWALMVESYVAAGDSSLPPPPPLPPSAIQSLAMPEGRTPEQWQATLAELAGYDPVDQAEFIRMWVAAPKADGE